MKRNYVESSVLASVGYDEAKNILEAEFKSGDIYMYLKVPGHIYEELLAANSIGEYFNSKIKLAGYNFIKIH